MASGCFRTKWEGRGDQWTVISNRCKGRNDERARVQGSLLSIKSNRQGALWGSPPRGFVLRNEMIQFPPGTFRSPTEAFPSKLHSLYEPSYVITCVDNITDVNFSVCLNVPNGLSILEMCLITLQ
jgi:hypothetical protein